MEGFSAAAKELEQILAKEPDNAIALNGKGYLAIKQGRDSQARQIFDRVLLKNPNDLYALTYRGMARRNLNDSKGSQEDLDRVVQIDPNNVGRLMPKCWPGWKRSIGMWEN